MATRVRASHPVGTLSVCAYVGVLIAVAIDHRIHGPALASSPEGVAAGRLVPLLSSGIVVDGPAWPQIALLTAALLAALRRLGAARVWTAAVSAHVGATLLAYAGVGVAWTVDARLVGPVIRAPDFGISVVLTGELGAILAASRNRAAIPAGALILALPGVAALAWTGTVDPFVLASAEHSLGFWLGALTTLRLTPTTGHKMINPRARPKSPTHSNLASPGRVIRQYRPDDEQAVLALALRAWAPVFSSLEQTLGSEIFLRVHGGWRYQLSAVRHVLADDAMHVWVAELERTAVGFVAAKLDCDRRIGEISMLAVEPGYQRAGLGSALTEFATEWLRRAGMQVAMVETGGDWGHAPARRVYQTAGYTPLPVARYFKAL